MANNPSPNSPKKNGGKNLRRLLPWLGFVCLISLLMAGFWPKAAVVEAGKVTVGRLRSTVNEEGKTRIRQRYTISAPVSGYLLRVPFKAGAEITSTQIVLAVLIPAPPSLLDARARSLAEAKIDTAAAQVERAQAAHKFATNELQRNEKLFSQKTISPQEMEQAQWRETAASRELAAAQAALRQAEAELLEVSSASTNGAPVIELRSPVCGKVLKVFEESARSVSTGTPILEIGDPTDLEVVVEALSRDGAIIPPGTPVEFEQWGGPDPLQGKVRYVEPAAFTKVSALGVEEQRVYVVADLLTPREKRGNLGDNFRVEARIITWQRENALKAPSGAFFRKGNDWFAYVIQQGRAELKPVKIGHTSGIETEILEGLKQGDDLILYPGDRVKPGGRVQVVQL